jgi:lambda repressor-like predicted transcriptional regulator
MEATTTARTGLGGVISDLMEDGEMSLRDLSTASSVPLTTLHRRLSAPETFTLKELRSIATALGVTANDLIERGAA